MSTELFGLRVKEFVEAAKIEADLVLRKIVLDVGKSVIMMSPVDTGRFRANWQFGYGKVNLTVDLNIVDVVAKRAAHMAPSGTTAKPEHFKVAATEIGMARLQAFAATLHAGKVIYLSNNLPYARRLEYGWSKQAPGGMVRITIARYQKFLDDAVVTMRAVKQP